MSSRRKSKRAKEEVKVKPAALTKPRVIVPPPYAMVIARHLGGTTKRHGRGFSFGELQSIGVSPREGRVSGLQVDPMRRSTLQPNVDLLKGWHTKPEPPTPEPVPEKPPKKTLPSKKPTRAKAKPKKKK